MYKNDVINLVAELVQWAKAELASKFTIANFDED